MRFMIGNRIFRMLPLATLLYAAAACGQRPSGVEEINESATVGAPEWTLEALSARLTAAGVQVVQTEPGVQQPFMTVPGVRLITADQSELQVFLYADQAARHHDTSRLDPHRVAPPHMMIAWRLPPTLLVSRNLAVILLTEHAPTRDHLKRAIAHGP